MYNRNNLQRNVLITFEEVLFHSPTKQNVDPRMIESSIIVAEERFIASELGTKFYNQLIDMKNHVIADGAELAIYQPLVGSLPTPLAIGDIINGYELMTAPFQALWKRHLWKLVAECVLVSAYPEGFVQFGSEGAFHNSPPAGLMVTSGQVVPLLSSMKWAVDKKVQDRIGPLVNSMHNYLCLNKTDFTYYTKDCPDCEGDELKQTKSAGIALNIYDDDPDDRNCCGGSGWLSGQL